MKDVIMLLPDYVANQIAAGEVIQRPASVVKELLENAIDAKAKKIQLIIKDSGKTLIQVIDDGIGMSGTDLRMAFERHATSKITSVDELFVLKTKGFRGEALASIAAVAQVECHSKQESDGTAQCIKIAASKVVEQTPSVAPVGTSIAVKKLFYNIPARRNFLKSDKVELRKIVDEFNRVALAHHELNFVFIHNGKTLFDAAKSNLRARINSVMGGKLHENLTEITEETTHVKLKGFVAKPEQAKKIRGQQFFFVNNRYIKSPFLHHAVVSAFEGLLQSGYHPGYFIYMEVNPASIDINIHPTKTEIKFENEQTIYAILRSAVRHSLGIFQVIPPMDFSRNNKFELPYYYKNKPVNPPTITVDKDFNPFKSEKKNLNVSSDKWTTMPTPSNDFHDVAAGKNREEQLIATSVTTTASFQLASRYIVCNKETSILIIDQNRAHQRILYEQFLAAFAAETPKSQKLFLDIEIILGTKERANFSQSREVLRKIGFVINEKNNNQLIISGIPTYLEQKTASQLIEELLNSDPVEKTENQLSNAHFVAKYLSKSLALNHGKILSEEAQLTLINQYLACNEPMICPEGKAIFMLIKKETIDKKLNE